MKFWIKGRIPLSDGRSFIEIDIDCPELPNGKEARLAAAALRSVAAYLESRADAVAQTQKKFKKEQP